MRQPRKREQVITVVLKRSSEACAGYICALVDDDFVDDKQGPTGTLFIKIEDAVTKWLCDHEFARKLIETQYGGGFSFGDLVDLLGGGYDDSSQREPPADTDLEKYLLEAGIRGMEVESFIATDPDNQLWLYDDPLFDEDAVSL